jgi:uncharacterized membrane protein
MMDASGCCCDGTQENAKTSSSAVEILAERFARGEIDKAEFEEKRQVLQEATKPAAGSGKGCC